MGRGQRWKSKQKSNKPNEEYCCVGSHGNEYEKKSKRYWRDVAIDDGSYSCDPATTITSFIVCFNRWVPGDSQPATRFVDARSKRLIEPNATERIQ